MNIATFSSASLSHFESPRFIITGGPSAGKTETLKKIATLNCRVVHEAATAIIQQELAKGVEIPQIQPGFDIKVLALQQKNQTDALAWTEKVFFDRSPIDVKTYWKKYNPDNLNETIEHEVSQIKDKGYYNKVVFVLEHLGFVDCNGTRFEELSLALELEERLVWEYLQHDYRVVIIPARKKPSEAHPKGELFTIEERAKLIVDYTTKLLKNPGTLPLEP